MYDLIIIGSGPAGYVAAIRAGQSGLKTAIVEKDKIGGMCLNWGCIPTKSILESAKTLHKVKQAAEFGIEGIDINNLSLNWKKASTRATKIVTKLTRGIEFLLKKNAVEIIKAVSYTHLDVYKRQINMLFHVQYQNKPHLKIWL